MQIMLRELKQKEVKILIESLEMKKEYYRQISKTIHEDPNFKTTSALMYLVQRFKYDIEFLDALINECKKFYEENYNV